jgi:hypothetical protein
MRQATIESEPEIDGDAVVLRIGIEDPSLEDTGGIFVCRMKGFGDITVERLLRDLAPGADGRLRALAAVTAMEYAAENHDAFESLFATLRSGGGAPSTSG